MKHITITEQTTPYFHTRQQPPHLFQHLQRSGLQREM
jgi:hypothetical protein